jgi:riboflavin biosynthesis protein RibD
MPPYLEEALALAAQGLGRVSPNPAVGAVIVRDDAVVGRGFHAWSGVKHAEVIAIEEAGDRARGATLYLTLEPCSHQGRTPPCADAIIAAGIKKVVAAMQDPNPQVHGSGFRALQNAGIEVEIDSTFTALDQLSDGNWWLKLQIPAGLDRYLVHKGSIAIDGISLTIAALDGPVLGVAIIPHTYTHTTLSQAKPGTRLNIEVDVLAKHVEKLLTGTAARQSSPL